MTRFRGWTIVAATHVLLAVVFGAAYSFGAFFEGIQARFDADRFSVASVFSTTAFLYYLSGAFSGALADRFSLRKVVGTGIVLLAIGFALNLVWLDAGSFAALVVFTLLFGAANGGCIALYPAVAAGWFGTRELGAILGALYIGVGIAALFGASAAGLLFDLRGSYAWPIGASAALALLSALCLARAARWRAIPDAPAGAVALPTIGA